jgi:hypothetical protein
VMVVGLTGFSRALPSLLGAAWADVPAVILWSSVALGIAAPIVSTTMGYLFAAGAAGAVAVATLASTALWCALAAVLLPEYGAPSVGLAWVAGATLNAAMLRRSTRTLAGSPLGVHWLLPGAAPLAGVAVAWLVGHAPRDALAGSALGLAAGEAVLLAGLALLNRSGLRDARALVTRGLRGMAPHAKRPAP